MVMQLHQRHHLELLASPIHHQLDHSQQPVSVTSPKIKAEPLHRLEIVTRNFTVYFVTVFSINPFYSNMDLNLLQYE
jgi:hypothetical protein